MSLSIIKSRSNQLTATEIFIEVHLANGLPCINMVGLPETAVKESKDRVRAAIVNCDFEFPIRRITINLAPADLPKEGSRFDLAIAIGILIAAKQIKMNECSYSLEQLEFYGELALSGELRPIKGIIPAAIEAKKVDKILIVAEQNAAEASLIEGIVILYASHLLQVCEFLNGLVSLPQAKPVSIKSNLSLQPCFSDVKGQQQAKRAFMIAAAGGHSMLLCGPPGSGKTMLASRMPSILPKMTQQQAMSSAAIRSINGEIINPQNWASRPFRQPHHTASAVSLVGGGSNPKPGEISLAHQGILFLDEIPEFSRHVLEVLREPLESGVINISRALCQVQYPASFQLIAAMNPCPCGYLGDKHHHCRCTLEQVQRYQNKLSGPFLDRIDLFVQLYAVPYKDILGTKNKPAVQVSSVDIQSRVEQAHQKQIKQLGKVNARLSSKELEQLSLLSKDNENLLNKAITTLNLSVRAVHRIIRVSKTIADLDPQHQDDKSITNQHLSEAIQYRQRFQ